MTYRKHVFATLLSLLSTSVLAQTQPLPPTAECQAIGQKLMAEINSGVQIAANAINLQAALLAAQAEIKVLKDKYEPTPQPAK